LVVNFLFFNSLVMRLTKINFDFSILIRR